MLAAFYNSLAVAPFDFSQLAHWQVNLITVVIGIGFGFCLERAGFGNARKLAAQFYFHDQSVLKVMFTAIITAMVLIYWSTALGLLDFDRVWVNPTYLWPGIIGGLLLGVGFIIGGYCPGTSVVSAATFKLDGAVFLLGCLAGIFVFSETVAWHQTFWETAGMTGRVTLFDALTVPYPWVVLGVVIMALGMFGGAQFMEKVLAKAPAAGRASPLKRPRTYAAAALVLAAVSLVIYAQFNPDPSAIAKEKNADHLIASRTLHIEPAELFSLMHNPQAPLALFDVRDEADYNLFHIVDAQRAGEKADADRLMRQVSAESIKVLMSNDEKRAEAAAREMIIHGASNIYILSGGINAWISTYAGAEAFEKLAHADRRADSLAFRVPAALGARWPCADPHPHHAPQLPFTAKVKLGKPMAKSAGGCGA